MYREEVRPLLPDELERIQNPGLAQARTYFVKSFVIWSAIWLSLVLVTSLVYAHIWPSRFLVVSSLAFALFELGNVGILFDSLKWNRIAEKRCNEMYPKVIAENLVQVTTVQSDRVAVLYERDDEGSLYVFDVGDNQLYWIHRQDPEPTLGNELWPNSHFEIIKSQSYPVEIGVRGLGAEIDASNVVELHHEDFDFDDFCVPDQELIQGAIDDIPKIFSLSNRAIVNGR